MKWREAQKQHLPENEDRRVKIPKSEHSYIVKRHKDGEAIRAIARDYNVDKRLIQFILYPERLIQSRKNRDWRKYHDRKALTDAVRDIRQRKAILFKVKKRSGKFNSNNSN